MCTDCGPLIDAIDRYIQKADDNLEEQLGSEGYEHPKDTVDTIKEIEEQVAAALKDESGRFLDAIAKATTLMSTEQTPVFFAAPKYPAMLSKLAKGRTESYGDSARGPTWQSHEQRFPAALQ